MTTKTRLPAALGLACALAIVSMGRVVAAEGEGPASRPAANTHAPAVTVLDLAGNVVRGRLVQMDLPSGVRLGAGAKAVVVGGAQVIWLGFDLVAGADADPVQWFREPPAVPRKKPEPAALVRVTLRDGQVLAGALQDPRKPDSLALEHRLLGSLDLPLARVQEVRIQSEPDGQPTREVYPEMAGGAFDVLWLVNGDRVGGILRSLGSQQVAVELASGQQAKMPTGSVQAVRLAEVPGAASAPASQPIVSFCLRLRSGERIVASKVSWDSGQGAVKFEYHGQPIAVPAGDLAGIEPITEKWTWLSNLAPAKYEHQPLMAPSLSWQADATARGMAIYCNAQAVLHGVGMPAGSTIRYDLGGSFTRLVVWPLLDDSAGPEGACKARILVDGQPAWQGTVKALSQPQAVTVNLAGKHELSLQVEPGDDDVLGRFVWAWPVLVR